MILKNPKHEIFAQELAAGKSAQDAAMVAGYAEKSARFRGSKLATKDNIRTRIVELQQSIARTSNWNAAKVLERLGQQADADLNEIRTENGEFLPLDQWPLHWRRMIQGVEIEQKFERSKDGGAASWDPV